VPAVIYIVGDSWASDAPPPAVAMQACGLDDPRRRMMDVSPQASTLPDMGTAANVTAIVFRNRFDALEGIRQAYPQAVAEPYLIRGIPLYYVVRLRSSCRVTPLLQAYDACG
jgi:hypothetical protein